MNSKSKHDSIKSIVFSQIFVIKNRKIIKLYNEYVCKTYYIIYFIV